MDIARALAEAQIAVPLRRARKLRDGAPGGLAIRVQVQPGGRPVPLPEPAVTGEDGERLQPHGLVEPAARIGEDGFEHMAHRQHCRPGIDEATGTGDLPHLAAGRRGGFKHRDTSSPRAARIAAALSPPMPAPMTTTRGDDIAGGGLLPCPIKKRGVDETSYLCPLFLTHWRAIASASQEKRS